MLSDGQDDHGFTLLELLVTMIIIGILSALSFGAYAQYRRAHDQLGSSDALVSTLRDAQERSASESRTYCVRIGSDSRSWTVWRATCGTGTSLEGRSTDSASVTLPVANRSFVDRSGATSTTDIYFYRSGMASAGTLRVASSVRSMTYTIRVEGLTGRVTSS